VPWWLVIYIAVQTKDDSCWDPGKKSAMHVKKKTTGLPGMCADGGLLQKKKKKKKRRSPYITIIIYYQIYIYISRGKYCANACTSNQSMQNACARGARQISHRTRVHRDLGGGTHT